MAREIVVPLVAIVGAILGGILGLFLAGKYVDTFMPAAEMEAGGPLTIGLVLGALFGAVAATTMALRLVRR